MYESFLKTDKFPHFFCAGCGDGIVLQQIAKCYEELGYTRENTVCVTGIGCWGKVSDYLMPNVLRSTHGRAPAFATGVALANPDLHVITFLGDGDGVTIGGNHLIHAARRNINMTCIMINNLNYGMTGGQYSGTTPKDSITKTSPYGHVEDGFDVCKLVAAAGGTFVARATVYDPLMIGKYIKMGLEHKGFSLIEVASPCPTHYGKNNKKGTAPDLIRWIKDNTETGIFVNEDKEDFSTRYNRVIAEQGGLK